MRYLLKANHASSNLEASGASHVGTGYFGGMGESGSRTYSRTVVEASCLTATVRAEILYVGATV